MKTKTPFQRLAGWIAQCTAVALLVTASHAGTSPHITAIGVVDSDLVISADAPDGALRLVLEGTERGELRAWRPRAVQRVSQPGTVTFRIPWKLAATLNIEMFRVRSDTNDPLPAAFYTGKTEFEGESTGTGNPMLYRGADGSEWVVNTSVPGTPAPTQPDGAANRSVVESDIWRLSGDRLYFFNHQRGLQIVDVANADAPALLATYPLPASGEQMYLMGEHHVVLLARSSPCSNDWGQDATSAAIVIDVSGDAPRETGRIQLQGRILESRLVGTALYVATDTWHPKSDLPEDQGVWVNGTRLSGIDLANPAQPLARNSVWLPGSGNVVTATDRYLLVGIQTYETRKWWESRLHVLDIQDPAGAIQEFTTLELGGRLQDKFKVTVNQDILTAITAGPSNADGSGSWRSALTTYRLNGPAAGAAATATRLGSVEVGHGEQLYATRFDGQRAYLVTFRQIDPLWIIDLSEPENPRVLGELEIPGWSTYIQPMGDRLLTVGFDNTVGLRAAVQLFDVSNPAKPALLSKVPLGKEWSWSEANSDEKALGFFPQAGLVLVPFSSSSADQQVVGVQIIDLERDTLTSRGRIDSQNVVPRRTAVAGDRVLAVSARDLTSVSIADRDRPAVRGRLELSYPVDRVIPVGEWLVEFSENRLRTRAANTPGETRTQLDLDAVPMLGATWREGRLYVLQGRPPETLWQNDQWVTNTPASVKLTVLDTSKLPDLTVLGAVSQNVDSWVSGDFEPLWPLPQQLVWSPVSSSQPWLYRGGPFPIDIVPVLTPTPGLTIGAGVQAVDSVVALTDALPGGKAAAAVSLVADRAALPFWRWWNPTPPTLFAFDVSVSTAPRFASAVRAIEGAYSASRASAVDGLVYFGHDSQEMRITGTNSYVNVISEPVTVTRDVLVTNIVLVPYDTIVTNVVTKEFGVPASQLASPQLAPAVAGTLHAVGLDASGSVFGWGDNRAGQLGSFALLSSPTPLAIAFPAPATSLAAATWFTLARLNDGSVWIAGDPSGPEAPPIPGQPDGSPRDNPIRPVLGLPSDIADVAAGSRHALARSAAGRLYTWGSNDRGQLGDGSGLDQPEPAEIPLGAPVTQIAGGGLHSLALTADGTVLAWGDNRRQQIGLGAPELQSTPRPVVGLSAIRTIAAGDFHSLALDQGQTVWSWGETSEFDDTLTTPPQPVTGLPPIRAIAAGRHHSVAVDLEGRVWSWGSHTSEPYRVQPLEPIQSVSARGSYAIASGVSGQTYLWQLGDAVTPFTGSKLALTLVSNTRTNVENEVLFREEIEVVTKTLRETRWVETTVTNSYPVYEYFTHHHLNVVDYNVAAAQPVVRPPVKLPGTFQGLSHQGALVYTLATRTDTDPKGNATAQSWLEASAYDGTAVHLVTGLNIANLSAGDSALTEVTPDGTVWLSQGTDGGKAYSLSLVAVNNDGRFEKRATFPVQQAVQDLDHLGNILTASFGTTVQLFRATTEPAISAQGKPFDLGCLLPGLHRLAGDPENGIWAPLGDYGSAPLP